jgi:nucleotide-binding universal stress UspA family protein
VTISTVAVGTDGSATAAEAVKAAVDMARGLGARIVLVSAFQDSGQSAVRRSGDAVELQWEASPAARLKEVLSRTEQELRRKGLECSTLADEGDPAEVLVRLAAECGADVLVIGNKGMHRRVLGSVPNTVTHKAPCSVFVVKTT